MLGGRISGASLAQLLPNFDEKESEQKAPQSTRAAGPVQNN
jgi:hypothetical protein